MTVVQYQDRGWDVGAALDDDRFDCPQCARRVRAIFSRVCGNFRVTMCGRCWKDFA